VFGAKVETAAKAHAIAQHPKEACGVVSGGVYVPLRNVARDPLEGFALPRTAWAKHAPVQAVIHSHVAPRHGRAPSAADMTGQMETGVPWGIVLTDGTGAWGPLWFGDHIIDEPLIGREFTHGVRDCYALVRAWFWQRRGVRLPDFARDDDWWNEGGDLYRDGFAKAGGVAIDASEAREGDVVLMQLHGVPVPHHAGVIEAGGLLLHHLPGRLSRREPLGPWRRYVTHWLRYGDG
jgi:cell wall-associated NlpC family hydrolase